LINKSSKNNSIRKVDNLIIKFRKDTTDEFIISEIFTKKEYDVKEFDIIKNPIIVDVGAHIGCFTLKMAKIFKDGNVFSFEPMKSNFNLLLENIELNKLSNVSIFNLGVARNEGKDKLNIDDNNTGGHSIIYTPSSNLEIIECITLENIFEDNNISEIDLLKLDCEGAEYQILYNLPDDYFKKIKNIILEYHDYKNNHVNELIDFLEKKGFNIIWKKLLWDKIGMMHIIRK